MLRRSALRPSPVTTYSGPDICGHCGFPVAWEESWQRGGTWNPPSAHARQRLTHSECSEDAFTLERWRTDASS